MPSHDPEKRLHVHTQTHTTHHFPALYHNNASVAAVVSGFLRYLAHELPSPLYL